MNELSQCALPAPLPSPDDRVVMHPPSAVTYAVVFGHFLFFGLLGQILFTFLMFQIPPTRHGNTRIPDSPGDTLMSLALGLPLVLAVMGAIAARRKPIHWLGHAASIALSVVAIGALAIFDMFMLMLSAMGGYC